MRARMERRIRSSAGISLGIPWRKIPGYARGMLIEAAAVVVISGAALLVMYLVKVIIR
jgi:hypothetical protein